MTDTPSTDSDPFADTVDEICAKDDRFDPEAYFFLRDALDFTTKSLNKPTEGPNRHVTGKELLEGLRAFILQEFGPMALTVLREWGITRTEDFGEIVFNLVESGRLGRTDQDTKADFAGGYDFDEAFAKPFRPASPRALRTPLGQRRRNPRTGSSARHEESK